MFSDGSFCFLLFHCFLLFLFFLKLPREEMTLHMAAGEGSSIFKSDIYLGATRCLHTFECYCDDIIHWLALLHPSFHFFIQTQSPSSFHINTLIMSLSPFTCLTCTFPVTHSSLIPFNPLHLSKISPSLTPPSPSSAAHHQNTRRRCLVALAEAFGMRADKPNRN